MGTDTGPELDRVLADVSRTFALTIPQLPPSVRPAISNAYLLCRTADTIEDSADLAAAAKADHYQRLLDMLDGRASPAAFSERLLQATAITDAGERHMLAMMPAVVAAYRALDDDQRRALRRCLGVMCAGMERFEHLKNPAGLPDRQHFRDYCYVVAGVVGEFLTELFCGADRDTARQRQRLLRLAPGFGQGLQMTNILKDVWDDRARGICWLPRDVFAAHGHCLDPDRSWNDSPGFQAGMHYLVGVAHHHLRLALGYTQTIPRRQTGIRRFCAWAIGMALYTLQNIRKQPGFGSGEAVKISRRRVRAIVAVCNACTGSNRLQQAIFHWASSGLPLPDGPTLDTPIMAIQPAG